MVASYAHHIAPWMDGTEGLSDGEYRVYHVVCQLIYLNNGPIALHESGIAGRCNQHVLSFRRHLENLIKLKKLTLTAAGKLNNQRAETELKARIKPPSDPPPTPSRPPPDPERTSAQPPPGHAAKPLTARKSRAAPKSASALTLTSSSTTDSESKVESKQVSAKSGERLPADWQPKPAHYAQGEKLGISRDQVDAYAERMRNWADANGHRAVARKSDWDAAFRNWLADKAERNGASHARLGPQQGAVDPIAAAAARRFGGVSRDGPASGPARKV